jgi:hypothetical protein
LTAKFSGAKDRTLRAEWGGGGEKLEYRISKSETISKLESSNVQNIGCFAPVVRICSVVRKIAPYGIPLAGREIATALGASQ